MWLAACSAGSCVTNLGNLFSQISGDGSVTTMTSSHQHQHFSSAVTPGHLRSRAGNRTSRNFTVPRECPTANAFSKVNNWWVNKILRAAHWSLICRQTNIKISCFSLAKYLNRFFTVKCESSSWRFQQGDGPITPMRGLFQELWNFAKSHRQLYWETLHPYQLSSGWDGWAENIQFSRAGVKILKLARN